MDLCALQKIIETGSDYEKETAIVALGDYGPSALPYVPFLLDLLSLPEFDDPRLSGAVGYAFDEIGGVQSYIHSPSFLQLLESNRVMAKMVATEQLLRFSNYLSWVNYELIVKTAILLDDHEGAGPHHGYTLDFGWRAFCSLDKWHPEILTRHLLTVNDSQDFWEKRAACTSMLTEFNIGLIGLSLFGEKAVPTLARLYRDGDSSQREKVIKMCFWVRDAAEEIIESGINDRDVNVASIAAHVKTCLTMGMDHIGEIIGNPEARFSY